MGLQLTQSVIVSERKLTLVAFVDSVSCMRAQMLLIFAEVVEFLATVFANIGPVCRGISDRMKALG